MLNWIYFITAFITIGEGVFYYASMKNKVNSKHLLIFLFMALSSFCYSLGTWTRTLEGIKLMNQLYYFGSILADNCILLIVAELCQFKLPKWFRILLVSFASVIIILVCTCNISTLYYKSISYAQYHGVSYLRKIYGPLHILLYIYLFGCNLFGLVIVMIALRNDYKVSTQTALILIVMYTLTTLSYAITRVLHFPLDVVPFIYVIDAVFLLHIFNRANMYDMSANLLNVYEQRAEYGYITFDIKRKFMGCNDFAIKVFPTLKTVPVDSSISPKDTRIQHELFTWMTAWMQGGSKEHVTEYGGITAVCTATYITFGKRRIGYLIELKDVTKQQNYINRLSSYSKQLEGEVENKNEKLINMQSSIISGMASMVESRDNSTGDHIQRTSAEVCLFTKQLRKEKKYSFLTDEYCNDIIQAAIMHDLGKISVDDEVLKKPGKFTDEDYSKMKRHSEEGARIVDGVLKEVDDPLFKKIAVNVAHYHHERWDGTGYPRGLKGEEIPIEARIMALADVFDALVSERCYKKAIPFDDAIKIIEENLGTHFDPELGKIFVDCKNQLEVLYKGN